MQRCYRLGCYLSDELLIGKNARRIACGETTNKMRVGQAGLGSDVSDGREMSVDQGALVSRRGEGRIDTEFTADEVVKEGLDNGRWKLLGLLVGLSGMESVGGRDVRGVRTSGIDGWMGCKASKRTLETGLAIGEVGSGSVVGRVGVGHRAWGRGAVEAGWRNCCGECIANRWAGRNGRWCKL